jgi:hypothetical protein
MLTTVARSLGEVSRRVRTQYDRSSALAAHDDAMRDPGVADDHAASISRAMADGKPGCQFCS